MSILNRPRTPPRTAEELTELATTPQSRGYKAVSQLLTPPSTGKASKTVRFALDLRTPTRSKRRFRSTDAEEESTLAEYTELENLSDASNISVLDESPTPLSPASPTEASVNSGGASEWPRSGNNSNDRSGVGASEGFARKTSFADSTTVDTLIQAEYDRSQADDQGSWRTPSHATNTAQCSTDNNEAITTEHFPFLKLPLNVRNRIFEILLVVPGLICVRQNHTSYHIEEKAYLYTSPRLLLPGIAYALPQLTVSGFKVRFSRFRYTNAAILRASKEVYAEAKAVMYGANEYEIVCPNMETNPPPDYKIPLFPRGCQRLVRSLSIRVRALYPLKWLMNGGYTELKKAYRGLEHLTIVFEMESSTKSVGKVLGKKEDERWVAYVTRLRGTLASALFADATLNDMKHLPAWINFRVMFDGEAYDDTSELDTHSIRVDLGPGNMSPTDAAEERLRRYHLKRGLPEAFEMLKK